MIQKKKEEVGRMDTVYDECAGEREQELRGRGNQGIQKTCNTHGAWYIWIALLLKIKTYKLVWS